MWQREDRNEQKEEYGNKQLLSRATTFWKHDAATMQCNIVKHNVMADHYISYKAQSVFIEWNGKLSQICPTEMY